MSLVLSPTVIQKPVEALRVTIAGIDLGTVERKDYSSYSRWHAVLNLPLDEVTPHGTELVQGHGETAKEAVHAAFTEHRKRARAVLATIGRFAPEVEPEPTALPGLEGGSRPAVAHAEAAIAASPQG